MGTTMTMITMVVLGCFLFGEVEPNATPLTAQFLGDLFVDDCVIINGNPRFKG
jgi:hypothetical protein